LHVRDDFPHGNILSNFDHMWILAGSMVSRLALARIDTPAKNLSQFPASRGLGDGRSILAVKSDHRLSIEQSDERLSGGRRPSVGFARCGGACALRQ
jgi:hypothetical protein